MRWTALTPLRIAVLLGVGLAAMRLVGVRYPELAGLRYLEQIDRRAQDYRLLQRGVQPGSPDVVIVAVDDASLDELGRWPWSRVLIAQLIDRLTAAGAAVIGFDVVQSEATTPIDVDALQSRITGVDAHTWDLIRDAVQHGASDDEVLATAVERSNRTVLGYFFDVNGKSGERHDRISSYNLVQGATSSGVRRIPHVPTIQANLPELTRAAREVGYFNFFPDSDGSYRRIPLAIRFGDDIALPLSLAMLRIYRPNLPLAIRFADFGVESVRFGPEYIPVAEDAQLLINFRGPGRTFAHYSAADVLAGRTSDGAFTDKLVLVGVTATAVADVRVTPFDGLMPGVEIHANVLDNILRDEFLSQPKWLVLADVGVILVAVLLLGVVLQFARGVYGAVFAGAMMGGYLTSSQWVFLQSGYPLSIFYPLLAMGFTYVAIALQHYVVEVREKRKIRNAFGLYLSPTLADLVSDRPEMLALGGDKRDLTVLFSDIRGFTSISEKLEPEVLVEVLNVYLGAMTDVIFGFDGTLDKYIGDAIMAFWGAPLPQADHALRACRAALGMARRLRELDEQWVQRGWPVLEIGIGLNSGPMVVGNMGSERRLSYTVMGDNVNLGSRLEGLTKMYGSRIIASESTVQAVGAQIVTRELDLVRVKGKRQPVRIFEVLGEADARDEWALVVERCAAGIGAYRQRRWDEAMGLFGAVLEARPHDGPARLYIERCRDMLAAPPDDGWDGVTVMEVK